jgi:hypothetical protein
MTRDEKRKRVLISELESAMAAEDESKYVA